jgi:hypothetical protein
MPMSEDEFRRLPPEVQRATREKESQQRIAELACEQRLKSRMLTGAMYAGFGSLVLTYFLTDQLAFLAVMALLCAAAGWLTVWLRCKLFGGMAIIGGVGVLANAVGAALGVSAPVFFVWIFYFALGGVVGAWVDGQRTMEDSGF